VSRAAQLAAVLQWQARYPPADLRDLGFGLLDIAAASGRAQVQLQQAIDRPNQAREAAQADRAVERLGECIARFNAEVAQMRTGQWPA
jgi:hypothetical protein